MTRSTSLSKTNRPDRFIPAYLVILIFIFSFLTCGESHIVQELNHSGLVPSSADSLVSPPEPIHVKNIKFLTDLDQPNILDNLTLEGVDVNVTVFGNAFDGYNILALQMYNRTTWQLEGITTIVTDMNGTIVLKRNDLGPPLEFINSTTILAGGVGEYPESSKAYLWNVYDNTTQYLGFGGHHEREYNAINNTYFMLGGESIEINETIYSFDVINEYNLTGHLIWQLKTSTFISISQWCPFKDMNLGKADITHANTLFFDNEDDIIYLNCRNLNTFYKIDHKSGEVIWGLGEYGNFTLFDLEGNPRDILFYHGHSVEKVEDGTFILFDNDLHNQTDPLNERSRILEIRINETTMTANESWTWIAPRSWYSPYWGDADRLPNGNRLGVFGSNHPSEEIGARLVEINNVGEIVWEMNFPRTANFTCGVYRMERFRFSPILSSPEDVIIGMQDNLTVNWDVWYNFRPKRTMLGPYDLYVNEVLVENGTIAFDKFWRPVDFPFHLHDMEIGLHNLTLAVYDEMGHRSVDSMNVSVVGLYVHREGPLNVEVGQEDSVITWTGSTGSPYSCNVTVNGTIVQYSEWTGSDIVLDLLSLTVGVHFVELKLYNSSLTVLTDGFSVTVYPAESPVIAPLQPSQSSIIWNESKTLSWDIFDNSPMNWMVIGNGTVLDSGFYDAKNSRLDYAVGILDEGVYNFTLMVIDIAGHVTLSTTWLEVLSPSPPIIASHPQNTELEWGTPNASLLWEVHGGAHWHIQKNGTVVLEGDLTNKSVELRILDWQNQDWRPGVYNLTMHLWDGSASTSNTVWIHVFINLGDVYADSVVTGRSEWFMFGENALGPPDNEFAIVYVDYGNGYITLDMGRDEEITDGDGVDFTVVAQGGEYAVSVGSSLDVLFTMLGTGQGNQSFDLAAAGIESARYVRVEYRNSDDVELDAIVALNYNAPRGDSVCPQISGIEDFWVWANQTAITLTWEVSDATPWDYAILVNGSTVEFDSWNGSDISYVYGPLTVGFANITLVLHDVFGNEEVDSVLVEVRLVITTLTTRGAPTEFPVEMVLLFSLLGGGACVALVLVWQFGRNKRSVVIVKVAINDNPTL